jgi:hypothetical protein
VTAALLDEIREDGVGVTELLKGNHLLGLLLGSQLWEKGEKAKEWEQHPVSSEIVGRPGRLNDPPCATKHVFLGMGR